MSKTKQFNGLPQCFDAKVSRHIETMGDAYNKAGSDDQTLILDFLLTIGHNRLSAPYHYTSQQQRNCCEMAMLHALDVILGAQQSDLSTSMPMLRVLSVLQRMEESKQGCARDVRALATQIREKHQLPAVARSVAPSFGYFGD